MFSLAPEKKSRVNRRHPYDKWWCEGKKKLQNKIQTHPLSHVSTWAAFVKIRELELIRYCPSFFFFKTAQNPKPKTQKLPNMAWEMQIRHCKGARKMMLWHVPYSVINFELEKLIVGIGENDETKGPFWSTRRRLIRVNRGAIETCITRGPKCV
jgi:hypothetical protein